MQEKAIDSVYLQTKNLLFTKIYQSEMVLNNLRFVKTQYKDEIGANSLLFVSTQ